MAVPIKLAAKSTGSHAVSQAINSFVPREVFEVSQSITRTYFLGHHVAGLAAMQRTLSNIGLIIECRDTRVPLTSSNSLLEASLAGRDRIIVYTKSALSFDPTDTDLRGKQERLLRSWHTERSGIKGTGTTEVVFTDTQRKGSILRLLDVMKERAAANDSLTGLRALVVGMPNAGKSSLLNAMRRYGLKMGPVAQVNNVPGRTRKLGGPVRVIEPDHEAGIEQGVYVLDTPGVFVPYVEDAEAMLKLALVGCVKDGVIPDLTLADYLLFHLNLNNATLYEKYCPPTNNADEWLDAIARRTGKLLKGGVPGQEEAAKWIIQQWRRGDLGRFVLDKIEPQNMRDWAVKGQLAGGGEQHISLSHARKLAKEARKVRSLAKRQDAAGS